MTAIDLDAVQRRYALARMAGEDAVDAAHGWDEAKVRALVASWQDVAPLHDEVKRLHARELDRPDVPVPPDQVELLNLGVMVTVMERMTPAERRRTLHYLQDRYRTGTGPG